MGVGVVVDKSPQHKLRSRCTVSGNVCNGKLSTVISKLSGVQGVPETASVQWQVLIALSWGRSDEPHS